MAAIGASPTYFDYDAFQEIQISTSGNDIRQPTGGVGINFVTKRGTNAFHGTVRGYFTHEDLASSNVPAELAAARGVTGTTPPTTTSRSRTTASTSAARSSRTSCGSGARTASRTSASSAHAGDRHRQDDPQGQQRQGELAGQQERHGQRALVPRGQGEVRPPHRQLRGLRGDRHRHLEPGGCYPEGKPPGPVEDRGQPHLQPQLLHEPEGRLLRRRLPARARAAAWTRRRDGARDRARPSAPPSSRATCGPSTSPTWTATTS